MSELRTNRIVPRDGLPSGSSGGVIQIKQTAYTGVKAQSGAIATPLTDFEGVFTCSLTPTRSDSKILIQYSVNGQNRTNGLHILGRLVKTIGGTQSTVLNLGLISYGNSSHDQIEYISGSHLDSPATTSAVTYNFQVRCSDSNTGSFYINYADGVTGQVATNASFMTLMEVSG